jgi:hypothetical protein
MVIPALIIAAVAAGIGTTRNTGTGFVIRRYVE